jgi:hypothetical protein
LKPPFGFLADKSYYDLYKKNSRTWLVFYNFCIILEIALNRANIEKGGENMWGEIMVSFGEQTNNIYVVLPDRDICLAPENLEHDIRELNSEQLTTIIELSRKRIKQIGMNFVSPTIIQSIDKIEKLFMGRRKKKHKLFPNR